ncbi:MAG: type VI secretion system membrane subunit TssM [Methylibium sp.]|uniref:type VI secretion system membrane subunit TssM n=1 Tax=Methylibium sp. TaxID=2067992 RepID=UPI0017D0DE73|nr:type VI secretion system membrane subunit TssM [Methylibium sp.]MBA3596207.1 type VI secretion system membrane subunit TssM [Methylibium sp.]
MNRFRTFLMDTRVLSVFGMAALATFLFVGADTLQIALAYAGIAVGLVLLIWFTVWVARKLLARRAARRFEQAIDEQTDKVRLASPPTDKADLDALRARMREAVKTIKTSRLGLSTGGAALYELPWYIVIGNPAAGKSTAVVKSGLTFPFADKAGSVVQGIGGTRNCDWFFTSEGILLDTAGRYSVHEEDRSEWLGFLGLMKRHRPKAPINGILIAASVAELSQARPEAAIQLAKNLRQRVQELTETLEVFAPVYLVFTKADLIAGFTEFFEDRDRAERERVWGATLPYDPLAKTDAVALFDRHFDELFDGLREVSVARMSLHRGQSLPPGVLTFPLEFAAVKPALRAFVATLFEDNPYQFPPVFRGFYFTSALQEGVASSRASEHVARQFALNDRPEHTVAMVVADNGFFLKDLFSRVIFADRNLVRQYTSRVKLRARALTFGAAVVALALGLGGWSWAYLGNRQLTVNVQADLDKAILLQRERYDLASRIEALEVLQDRIEQLDRYRTDRPLAIGLGLYQGRAIEAKLRAEYFAGVEQIMVQPVAQALEAFLGEVNRDSAGLQPMTRAPESAATPLASQAAAPAVGLFTEASPRSAEDAYNALKTYLMLGDRPRMEAGHLTDQITRFWRGWLEANRGAMPREQMIRSAERMIGFTIANLQDPAFPVLANNLSLIDQTRENLQRVVRGMAARERVYADVKARASTRFPQVTVARIVGDLDREVIAGSYAIPGTFTREAWDGYIEQAFKEAATKELQSADWVLKTAARDDLTLEGSPEQIRKALTDLYKAEYVREWQRFMQGVSVAEFGTFQTAVLRMNRLGDPVQSPIRKVMQTLFDQTSWDNPSILNERLAIAQRGILGWFKQTILRQAPSRVDVSLNVGADKAEIKAGPIGREFAVLARLMMTRDNSPTQMAGYLEMLSRVRTKFNQIKTQGDPGPAARQLMAATLASSGSELAEALKYVDEQMLVGMTDSARATLRPLLVRPLIQAFGVIVEPAETEINRVWAAQVREPFQRMLMAKYPFDPASRIEAAPAEIAKVFGPDGAVAKFTNETLTPLVVRRGDTLAARTWADAGIRLRPRFSAGFAGWVAPLEGGAAPAGGPNGAAATPGSASQTVFQILPQGSPGLTEYTIEIDGQKLRYRNAAPAWQRFVWPNEGGTPGARITAVTHDGATVNFLDEPGRFALTKMFESAERRVLADNLYELSWVEGKNVVTAHLRIVSQPGVPAPTDAEGAGDAPAVSASLRGARLPNLVVGVDPPPGGAAVQIAPQATR